MADHWRSPHTDEEARGFCELEDATISREVMIAIIMGCIGWIIGFGMGMVVS